MSSESRTDVTSAAVQYMSAHSQLSRYNELSRSNPDAAHEMFLGAAASVISGGHFHNEGHSFATSADFNLGRGRTAEVDGQLQAAQSLAHARDGYTTPEAQRAANDAQVGQRLHQQGLSPTGGGHGAGAGIRTQVDRAIQGEQITVDTKIVEN